MNCQCKDWQAAGELFHEAIGMIAIDYCPWCGVELNPATWSGTTGVHSLNEEPLKEEPPDEPTNKEENEQASG